MNSIITSMTDIFNKGGFDKASQYVLLVAFLSISILARMAVFTVSPVPRPSLRFKRSTENSPLSTMYSTFLRTREKLDSISSFSFFATVVLLVGSFSHSSLEMLLPMEQYSRWRSWFTRILIGYSFLAFGLRVSSMEETVMPSFEQEYILLRIAPTAELPLEALYPKNSG